MLLFNFPKKKKEINGIIKYLNLEGFWRSCSDEEQGDLVRYYQSGVAFSGRSSPIEGTITSTSNTALKYLSSMLGWASKENKYSLADKIIIVGKQIPIGNQDLLDAHFFYQEAAEYYYKQRNSNPNAIHFAEECCQLDVSLFPQYAPLMKAEYGAIPRIITIKRLIGIFENAGRLQEAIKTCKMAIQYGLSDNTKGGYPAKLEKLEKANQTMNKESSH